MPLVGSKENEEGLDSNGDYGYGLLYNLVEDEVIVKEYIDNDEDESKDDD